MKFVSNSIALDSYIFTPNINIVILHVIVLYSVYNIILKLINLKRSTIFKYIHSKVKYTSIQE